ncbi:hypothetical protein [Methanobacterium spitsbergense]|uniref:Uncharacterized protein n=1 Tax=Methanobacterium spitsbergense TaxID=2874285 RepID=A0A8T5ULJ4_9EURY|nr:hypothetical protein [Methanobacterium spitsbergense]MBZ2164748.1 hypothetical protein [Methanobacterium spitsbergense]
MLENSILNHKSNNSSPGVMALFSHPIVLLKAEKEWVQEFMGLLITEETDLN